MPGRTTLLVAHRRSTLHLADKIAVLDEGRVVAMGTHDELTATSPLYRSLLSGLERDEVDGAGDRIEVLATISPSAGVGAATEPPPAGPLPGRRTASHGSGPADCGGGWRLNLAPTPELLTRVAALRPVRDFPHVDVETETRHQHRFSLGRLLSEYRGPLGLGLVLVALDAVASLAGPVLVKEGIDRGVATGSTTAVFVASLLFLAVVLADLIDQVGSTFVTGRTAQRIMMSLRIRIWAQLQRLSLDYYEREMAGRIMTRMTTDIDQFESLIENGLLSALVSMCTFVGVGAALFLLNVHLALVTLSVVVPLAFATVAFRRRAARIYDLARERIAVVNADFQESLSGIRESQAFVHEELATRRFRQLGRQYLEARVAAQRLVATYFPLSRCWETSPMPSCSASGRAS